MKRELVCREAMQCWVISMERAQNSAVRFGKADSSSGGQRDLQRGLRAQCEERLSLSLVQLAM